MYTDTLWPAIAPERHLEIGRAQGRTDAGQRGTLDGGQADRLRGIAAGFQVDGAGGDVGAYGPPSPARAPGWSCAHEYPLVVNRFGNCGITSLRGRLSGPHLDRLMANLRVVAVDGERVQSTSPFWGYSLPFADLLHRRTAGEIDIDV